VAPTSERTIVVGLDNTPGARAALRWAVDHASRIDAVVHAVHALELLGAAAPLEHDVAGTRATVQGRAHAWTAEALAESRFRVPVTVEVRDGDAATVLGEAARGADMLVLGMNVGTDHSAVTGYAVPLRCEVVLVEESGRAHQGRDAARVE